MGPMPLPPRPEHAARLLGSAGHRTRMGARERRERLLVLLPALVQTAVAAALASLAATELLGHPTPFLAVIAAIIVLSQAYGQRTRRALEFAVGVVLGVVVADLVLLALGTGPVQIGLIVLLATVAAVLLGAGRAVVTQSATTAALVATVTADAVDFSRAADALLGGAVALLVAFVLLPIDPVKFAAGHRAILLEHLGAALEDVAAALGSGDHDRAEEALARARDLDGYMAAFAEAAMVGSEIARGAPLRRGKLPVLRRNAAAAVGLSRACGNVRVLARGAIRAADLHAHVPLPTVSAVRELAAAVRELGPAIDDSGADGPVRERALRAAAEASLGLEQTTNLSVSVIVGQVRSTAADLLAVLGVDAADAPGEIRAAAARAAADEPQGRAGHAG